MNRKTFIQQTGRGLLLGSMAFLSLFFVKRSQLKLDSCDDGLLCDNCREQKTCQLPKNLKLGQQSAKVEQNNNL